MSINIDRKKRLKTEKMDTATDQSIDGNESRALRSGYLSIQNYIRDQKDQIAAASSKDFLSIIKEVDGMHHLEMAQKSASKEILDETKIALRRNLLSGPNFNDWFRSLRIVLRVMERLEIVSTPMIPMPTENASQSEQDSYKETYKKYNEVACLMLSSMTPELVKQFEQKWPDQMITELRILHKKQADLELKDLIRDVHACHHVSGTPVGTHVLHMKSLFDRLDMMNYAYHDPAAVSIILNSLSPNFEEFTRTYNMQGMKKSLNELHAMLVEFEKSISKRKVKDNQILVIGGGEGQKRKKQPLSAKRKVVKARKNKQVVYSSKLKQPPPTKKEKVAKDDGCHHCGIKRHWKRNCPKYLDEVINKKNGLAESSVKKPREQVSDAATLRDLANTLVTSLRVQNSGSLITPSLFVSSLINAYGKKQRKGTKRVQLHWKDLGVHVSRLLKDFKGSSTMFGPMLRKPKPRKAFTSRKGRRVKELKRKPEEIDGISKEQSETDLTIAKMFDILKRKRNVCLENLVLNRISFAQTVENLFALSFLVKDGRVVVTVDEEGSHHVSPRNAPASRLILSHEVEYSHFIFSFNFNDWKLMKDFVAEGSEVMPHRTELEAVCDGFSEPVPNKKNNQDTETVTKTYSRKNRMKQESSCEIGTTAGINSKTYSGKNRMELDESREIGRTGLKLLISMSKRKITCA